MAQQQVAFDLLQSVEDDAHQDQQRGTAVEQRELVVDAQLHREGRQDSHDRQEDGARKGDPRQDGVEVFDGSSYPVSRPDEASVAFHVLGHHVGVHGNRRVEIGEGDHQQREH